MDWMARMARCGKYLLWNGPLASVGGEFAIYFRLNTASLHLTIQY
jgi:hypothetical protein